MKRLLVVLVLIAFVHAAHHRDDDYSWEEDDDNFDCQDRHECRRRHKIESFDDEDDFDDDQSPPPCNFASCELSCRQTISNCIQIVPVNTTVSRNATCVGKIVSGTSPANPTGYYIVTDCGMVFPHMGTAATLPPSTPFTVGQTLIVDIATTSLLTTTGYYLLAANCGLFSFGDAIFEGSPAPAVTGCLRIFAVSNTGYFIEGPDGHMYAFGTAVCPVSDPNCSHL